MVLLTRATLKMHSQLGRSLARFLALAHFVYEIEKMLEIKWLAWDTCTQVRNAHCCQI